MFRPIFAGLVPLGASSFYQLDYYDGLGAFSPWMVARSLDLGDLLGCYHAWVDHSQRGGLGYSAYLYNVSTDGSYQCVFASDGRNVAPYGLRELTALHQLRTAGVCRG